MNIIIADRDENSAGRLGRILKGLSTDAEILHFSDPMYVVKYGLTNPVDMLFTEVRMKPFPLDGLTLIQRIREKYPSVRCYVVTETENYIEQASAIRVNGYLLKPVSAEQIHRAMFEGNDAGDET